MATLDEIIIKYWSPHGRQEETKFQCNDIRVDLVMRAAQRIDLDNLSKCLQLQKLDLSQNMLEEIDFTPLSNCSELEEIILQSNHLTQLDLWPLRSMSKLRSIDLTQNRIRSIDMTPIYRVDFNQLDSSVVVTGDAVLQYIFTKQRLKRQFRLLRSDEVNWSAAPVVIWNSYSEMKDIYSWPQLRERIEFVLHSLLPLDWYGVQRGLMKGFDISMLGGFDGNPELLLEKAKSVNSYEEARQAIFDTAVMLIEEQLQSGGPTLFLDIEQIKDTSASKLIPHIVDRRRAEIEKTVLYVRGSTVYLSPLWTTHYGYKILSVAPILKKLNFKGSGLMSTDLEGLEVIRKYFDELDLELVTQMIKDEHYKIECPYSLSLERHMMHVLSNDYD